MKRIIGFLLYFFAVLICFSIYGNIKRLSQGDFNLSTTRGLVSILIVFFGSLLMLFFLIKYAIKWTGRKTKDDIDRIDDIGQ